MTGLRLQPETEAVRTLTSNAVAASSTVKPTLVVRCDKPKCGRELAQAGHTDAGPLWTASWRTDPEHGVRIFLGDRKLGAKAAAKWMAARPRFGVSEGSALAQRGRDGYVALLALPAGTPDDYPDLLVRCPDHGDAVLDRLEVLDRLRRHQPPWMVDTALPMREIDSVHHE